VYFEFPNSEKSLSIFYSNLKKTAREKIKIKFSSFFSLDVDSCSDNLIRINNSFEKKIFIFSHAL
jgi:hypothetical protein